MEKYLKPIADFLESNDWSENEPEFILLQYDIADKMKADKIGIESIQPIIELMEKNPLVEFGTPGPLTHFVEQFYNDNSQFYENILTQSILNQPALHTVWLLNRIINGRAINGTESDKVKKWIQILKSINEDKTIHEEIRMAVKNFLKYQNEN